MNKKLLNALLCGVAILSVSVFNSCKTDLSDLDTRLKVLEVAWADLKSELGDAVVNGLYITAHGKAANGESYDITFSDGRTINIPLVDGGGTEVSVVIANGVAIITIDGEPFEIPLGSAVSSLVYLPEYEDGYVLLGNDGANVKFLATPAVEADDLVNATFKFADIYPLQARTRVGGNTEMVISGKPTLDNGYVSVPVKGILATAGQKYSVAIEMSLGGTTISSDYFTVQVSEDFFFDRYDIDGSAVLKNEYNPVANADESYTITVDGLTLLEDFDFSDLFSALPEGGEFEIASSSEQPAGDAQSKQAMLATSLAKDGTWEFSERPGTNFGATGFQFYIVKDYVVKAKTYVVINDAIAALPAEEWNGGLLNDLQAEWGGRNEAVPMGASTIDMPASFLSYTPEGEGGDYAYPIIHGDRAGFFGKWPDFYVGDGLIYNNGQKLVLSDDGQAWAAKSRGIVWFCRGFAIVAPEPLATTDGKYVDELGRSTSGGEIVPNADWWANFPNDFRTNGMMQQGLDRGFAISADGVISFPESYTGYGLRLGIGAAYEYAYGEKKLGPGDQFGLFFFNRRMAPEGATMPPAIP